MLEHTLQVNPDTTSTVKKVIDNLQEHIRDSSNELLQHRVFTSSKHTLEESLTDLFNRLKSFMAEIKVCKGHTMSVRRHE